MPDELEIHHNRISGIVRKLRIHQWRTDLRIIVEGREYYLCREEAAMTRGEVKEIARRWIAENWARMELS